MRKYIKNVISVFLVIVMLMSQVQTILGKRDRLKEFTETINFIFLLII